MARFGRALFKVFDSTMGKGKKKQIKIQSSLLKTR